MITQASAPGIGSLNTRPAVLPPHHFPWKTRVALPLAIVAAVLCAAGFAVYDAFLPRVDVRVTPAILMPTTQSPSSEPARSSGSARPADVVAQAAGWVEPDPYPVAVSALTDGTVREVLVLEGQPVKAGDVVARLVDDDARLAVERAEAELASAQAELDAAQQHWDNPVSRRLTVAVAKAALDQAKAELAKLADDLAAEQARAAEMADLLARLERLDPSRSVSEQELISTRYRALAQQAVVKSTEARRAILEATIAQRAAELTGAEDGARLRIEEARTLASARAAVMRAKTQLAEATLRLSRMEIRAPVSGVVMMRLIEPGGKLMLGMDNPSSAYVARLYDPAKLQVRVDVPLADASKIGVATPAEITVEALPGQTLRGEVTRIVHEADVSKNTLQFKVRIIDPPPGLKPEMLARVRFLASNRGAPTTSPASRAPSGAHLPFIPQSLVQREGDSTYALIVEAGVAVKKPIRLGSESRNGWIAVQEGVSAGDRLVAYPAEIRPGTRIRILGEADINVPGKAD